MKKMNDPEKFTDKEWEKLASALSGEEAEQPGIINRYMEDDFRETGEKWKMLKDMGNPEDIDVDRAWSNVSARMQQAISDEGSGKKKITAMRLTLVRIAAVALILISLGTGLFFLAGTGVFSRKITFATNNDQKNLRVELADGSVIFLNRSSELTYRSNFGKNSRNVTLRGEAFFDISSDTPIPFIIDAGNALVKVAGTSFNVITSNAESEVEVYVKTGKVIITGTDTSLSLEIDPGYIGKIVSDKPEKTINKDVNYLSWNTELLVYTGETLDVVFKDLRRVYNMNIVADDPSILENRWTSPIDNQSKETIIRLICVSFNLSYSQDGDVYHLVKK